MTLALVALIGFVGLALDVGFAWGARRRMQTAADAAATAGAVASRLGYTITPAAKDAASLNGFTDGTSGVSVNVTSPYSGGSCSSNCVKVSIDQAQSTYFLRVLGYSSIDVKASAVAGAVNSGSCVYTLDKSASPGLKVSGNANISLSCGAIVNSTQSPGATCSGSATFTATSIGVAGTASGGCFTPSPTTGVSDVANPFSSLGTTAPSCSGGSGSQNITNGQIVVLNAGSYCGGITIHNGATVTLTPGTYNLGSGGLKVTGGTIIGTGVTFVSSSAVSFTGNPIVNLSAPTSGTYEGILFFDTDTNGSEITGTGTSSFDGSLYFPNSNLKYSGNSSTLGYTIIAAGSLEFTGGATLGDNYSSLGGQSPIQSSTLYE